MTVRTRFAPSPTGYLHIGGVRTALFNWLFARQHGGQFLLRVDDTDQQRNVEAALAPILHGFRWLGLDWDELPEVGGPYAPYYQSQRSVLYQTAVNELLARGAAYRDFATTEEIQAERDAARLAGRQFVYSRKWAAETSDKIAEYESQGLEGVVRLKMPRDGELVISDLIRGDVRFSWINEQDHVVQRADGTCLYHLASVVDDYEMKISHVIRAEEHLSNTPRQIFIAQSLGYPLPAYAHLPYVAEPGSKNKLSKRKLDKYLKNKDFYDAFNHGLVVATNLDRMLSDFAKVRHLGAPDNSDRDQIRRKLERLLPVNIPRIHEDDGKQADAENLIRQNALDFFMQPEVLESYVKGTEIAVKLGLRKDPATFNPVIVDFYEAVGYLSEALLNYLLLLGWSFDAVREEFTLDEMIRLFSLERVNKAPASFDPKKLLAFQDRAMQKLPIKKKVAMCLRFLKEADYVSDPPPCDIAPYLTKVIQAAGDRIKVAGDILFFDEFFVADQSLPVTQIEWTLVLGKSPNAIALLREFSDSLNAVTSFDPMPLELALKDFCEMRGADPRDLIHPLRYVLTGKRTGLGLYDALAILGRERCQRRIERVLEMCP